MSTPRTLVLPAGVEPTRVETTRGAFAAQTVRPEAARAHVLLVPGWTGSKEDFTPLLPLLADAGYAATTIDQRGQFETPGTDADDYGLAGLAADVLAVAAACDDEPSHLLGHSFGGLVAQAAAVASPSAWRTLGLLCTGPGALGSSPTRPLDRLVASLDAGTPMTDVLHALKGASLTALAPDVRDFLERRFEGTARASLRAMTQHLLDAPDVVDQVAATGLPVWVGRGVGDDAWPHDAQASMAERLGTEVRLVPDADHSPAVENPEGLAAVLIPFLDRS